MTFANVSIDLDGLGCYHAIHGLDESADREAIYRTALPRFLDLFTELGIHATFFVIAADLDDEPPGALAVATLRQAIAQGHEVASHTYGHAYDLRRRTESEIGAEIDRAAATIERRLGVAPVGFRTPGYNIDSRIMRALVERGYRYDSSVFPSPPYYAAKGIVMAAMAASGRPSRSAITHPAALRAPLQPYRPSPSCFSRSAGEDRALPIWEIPIGVLPGARLPVIGTTVGAVPPRAASALAMAMSTKARTVQFEMHAVDLMDATDSGITAALAARQPDLQRPVNAKRAAFYAFLDIIADRRPFVTLVEACDLLDERLPHRGPSSTA